jgi:uridine phosphorylase
MEHTVQREFPILEFDPNPDAILSPRHGTRHLPELPERAVLCFFHDVITELHERGEAVPVCTLNLEMGPQFVYRLKVQGEEIALVRPGVGAPLAVFALEKLIALGCTTFIVCGGAGVLDREIAVGHLVVPTSAVRDEGTSYHYLPPSREVEPDPEARAALERTLSRHGVNYRLAKTWTTDGLYRETAAKVQLRRSEGCAVVEMEASALFAVARFRGVKLAQVLYGGDDVSGMGEWDHRDWQQHSIREQLLWLAAEAALDVGRG